MRAFIAAAAERRRQIHEEGFGLERDDQYRRGELSLAAHSYATEARLQVTDAQHELPAWFTWPWDKTWWKPSTDPKRNLIKAMALLAAEYDRLERAEAVNQPPSHSDEVWSRDDEVFRHGSLQELLDAEDDLGPGATVYVGTPVPVTASDLVDADRVIEEIDVAAGDLVGDCADYYPDVTPEEKQLLQELLEAWVDHVAPPGFSSVDSPRPHVVTAEDLSDRLQSAGQA